MHTDHYNNFWLLSNRTLQTSRASPWHFISGPNFPCAGGRPPRTSERGDNSVLWKGQRSLQTPAFQIGGPQRGPKVAQGTWTQTERQLSFNVLEIRAIKLALKTFHDSLQDSHVLIRTDNVAAKAHINYQEGLSSPSLHQESLRALQWAEQHLLSMTAKYIKGMTNTKANWLSQSTIHPGEWNLAKSTFNLIPSRLGSPVLDLFATSNNSQLPWFTSR